MSKKSGSSNSKERILQMFDDTIGESETISATVDALKKLPIDDIKRIQEGKFDKFTGSLPIEDPLESLNGPYFMHFSPKNLNKKNIVIENVPPLKTCKKENFISRFIRFFSRIIHKRKKDD